MFCGKCGTQNDENAVCCVNCGAALNDESSAVSNADAAVQPAQAGAANNNRKIGIAAAAIAALVVVFIFIGLFGGRSYKSVVKKYVQASFTADGKKMLSILPDEAVELACRDEAMTKRELIEYMTETIEDQIGHMDEIYGKWSFSYKIVDVEDYSGREFRSMKEDYKDELDLNVKEAKTVTVEITLTADGDEIVSAEREIDVVKIGRSWYLSVSEAF